MGKEETLNTSTTKIDPIKKDLTNKDSLLSKI